MLRVGDGVLGVHDLEVPVDRGLGGERHGQQRADGLHRAGDHGGGGEERDQRADAELAVCDQQDADHEGHGEGGVGQQRHHQGELASELALSISVWRSSSACSSKASRASRPRPKAFSTRMPCTDSSTVVARSPAWSWLCRETCR